jgi:thiol:disulfide interchange protein
MNPLHTSLSLGICLCFVATARAETPVKPTPNYTVDSYDPKRNPADDLKMTAAKAKAGGKRVLIQVGGDWCGWCHLMTKYFQDNEKVASALAKDYLIMKVNYSEENHNEEFLDKYPKIPGYPHLYVLDSDGKLLHSQNTEELEEGKGYSETAVLKFLSKWATRD